MSETLEVDGTEYELDDNPSLLTVREVQSMQMGIIMDYVSEDKLMNIDSLEDESQLVKAIIEEGGYKAFQDVMYDRSMLEPVQTISLACDDKFSPSDFNDMGARDFKDAKNKSEEVLGGDASDFFNDLGIGLSLNEEEMKAQAQSVKSRET